MNIITKLSIRQKVMLTLTVLAAAFLVWQIYNFVHGNTSPGQSLAAVPVPSKAVTVAPNALPAPTVQSLPANSSTNPALTYHQQQYLGLVREYQVTKMKRQILEEEASLANAQKRIADAGKNGSVLGVNDYAGVDSPAGPAEYQLAYLDRQAGQWTATLSQGSQYQEVHVGAHLADGMTVVSISNKGVILRPAHGKSLAIGFQGSVNVDNRDNSVPVSTVKARSAVKKQPSVNVKPAAPANSAKIAKILGITAVPAAPAPATAAQAVAAPAPTAPSSTDIPAAPLTAQPTAPVPPAVTDQPAQPAPQPSNTQPADTAQATTPPVQTPPSASSVKPVSVKELREQSVIAAETDGSGGSSDNTDSSTLKAQSINQISWEQAADLQAAATPR